MVNPSTPATPARRFRWLVISAALGMLGAGPAVAQDATPAADIQPVDVVLNDLDGNQVGTASFNESEAGVEISVEVEGLEPGDHGLHIHETGECDPAAGDGPFSSAGGHFNPQGNQHGAGPQARMATPGTGPTQAHAGDLGNITVEDDGTGAVVIATDLVTLEPGAENSLADDDGSALVVHENADDLATDPSGDSGGRIACGVIFPPMEATPADEDGAGSETDGEAYRPGDEPVQALDALIFTPKVIIVSPGDTIEVINTGNLEHDFTVDELGLNVNLPNGQLMEIEIPDAAAPGEYEFYCSVPGHRPAGMYGTLIVE